jgi:hypothetical protein
MILMMMMISMKILKVNPCYLHNHWSENQRCWDFFEVISWDEDLFAEVKPFLLCRGRICQRSLPRGTLPEFAIVINFENSLLIKINLSNCRDSPFEWHS